APKTAAKITIFVLLSVIAVTQFKSAVLSHPKGPPRTIDIRTPVDPTVIKGKIIRGNALDKEPLILTLFLTQFVSQPAKNPATTAPKKPAFVSVANIPPTKPAARAGFPAIE